VRGRALLLLAALLVPALPAAAQTEFRLVAGADAKILERELQSAGVDGFRFLAAGEGLDVSGRSRIVALLERDAAAAVSRDFSVLTCSGNFSVETTREAVEALAADGYRLAKDGILVRRRPEVWLPDTEYDDQTVLVFERDGSDERYEYDAIGFRNFEAFHNALAVRRAAGYEILGMWNTGRKLQVVIEGRNGAAVPTSAQVAEGEYRLLLIATRRVLKHRVNAEAARGYRLVDAEDPPTVGPPILLMRKTANPDEPIEYRFTKRVPGRMRKGKLEKKLNKRSRNGWRLPPGGITDAVLTLEREEVLEKEDPHPLYRVVSSGKLEELPEALDRSVRAGYEFVKLFVEPSRTSALLVKNGREAPASVALAAAGRQ
jgi:hypothetical protein